MQGSTLRSFFFWLSPAQRTLALDVRRKRLLATVALTAAWIAPPSASVVVFKKRVSVASTVPDA